MLITLSLLLVATVLRLLAFPFSALLILHELLFTLLLIALAFQLALPLIALARLTFALPHLLLIFAFALHAFPLSFACDPVAAVLEIDRVGG
ncbi:MAG: hypothetical protein JO200_17825, partial [Comamonas sp.]|nr:hypothetical protein [Comamonas sp.]